MKGRSVGANLLVTDHDYDPSLDPDKGDKCVHRVSERQMCGQPAMQHKNVVDTMAQFAMGGMTALGESFVGLHTMYESMREAGFSLMEACILLGTWMAVSGQAVSGDSDA